MYFCCTLRKRTYFVLTHVSRVFYAVPVALCAFLCTICVHCAKGAQCINARQTSFFIYRCLFYEILIYVRITVTKICRVAFFLDSAGDIIRANGFKTKNADEFGVI